MFQSPDVLNTSKQKSQLSFNKTGSIRNFNQSPKMVSLKANSSQKDLFPRKNSQDGSGNINAGSTKDSIKSSKVPSLLDVKLNSYSKGPKFKHQFGKPAKTVSQVFGAKLKQKTQEEDEKEFNATAPRDIKTANTSSNFSLFNRPSFQRELHKTGPTFHSKEFIEKTLNEQHRLLYTSVAEKTPKTKELKLIYNKSDVFNMQASNPSELPKTIKRNNSTVEQKDYNDSDIFCTKNNKMSLSKSSEKSSAVVPKYGITTKSESEWYPKTSKASLVNHESSNLNILNLGVKGIGVTKEDIIKDGEYCANKKKSIAEYTDLFRNFSPNPNHKYLKCLKGNKNEFKQTSNVCANYGDLFHSYKSAVEHPFLR